VRESLATPLGAPVMIAVGSLTREKRVDRMLRVLRELLPTVADLHLWVVGGGPLRPELERLAEELGVAPRVRWCGVCPDVGTYLAAADLFVLTSDTEGMPGVVLEAGWCGLAAVATNVGGTRECLLDQRTGLLVPAQDEARLVGAVECLLRDSDERRRMGAEARCWVTANFELRRVAETYAGFYGSIR
jgi:glycosyltransferase involved in cell wall biosynthesis